MAGTDKAKFLASLKARGGKDWKKAREAKAEQRLTAPNGNYIGRLRAVTYDLDKNGNPYFMFRIFLTDDDEDINGQPAFKSHFLTPPKKGQKQTMEGKLANLKKDFERCGIDLAKADVGDMVAAAEQLSEERPALKVSIKHDPGDPKANPPRKPGHYEPSIFINGIAADDEVPEVDEPEDEAPEDDDDSGTEDADDEGGDEDAEPETDEDGEGGDDDGDDVAAGEDEGEDSEPEDDDDAPPEDFEEAPEPPKRGAKKPAAKPAPAKSTGKPPAKAKAAKFAKGDKVLYVSRAGGKATEHVVLSIDAAGLLKLKNAKTGAIFKDIAAKSVTKQ